MHNHLAYNALPLWGEPGRTAPWLHNKHWPSADTYTESITEPAWTYAKACPEALLAYVQVREMAGGATAAQGWPTANRGYRTVMRNIDAEKAGQSSDDLIYTSVVTKTGEALANSVRRMGRGRGLHLPLRRGAAWLASASATSPTSNAPKDCCRRSSASTAAPSSQAGWVKWTQRAAGGVVWSPLSNIVLYAQTTLVDDVRARGVRVCLGSDWGPSGTRNLLGEMKVARIAARHFGFTVTDRDIVQMVTTNPGVLLERCWGRPIGRLVPGAFADLTVIRGHGSGDAWQRILAATERHVEFVVIDGVPRYGMATLMRQAGSPAAFAMTVRGRARLVALPDPRDPTKAWSWPAITDELTAVQARPADGDRQRDRARRLGTAVRRRRRARAVPRHARHPPNRAGPGRPRTRRRCASRRSRRSSTTPRTSTLLDELPIQAGVLSRLRKEFGR